MIRSGESGPARSGLAAFVAAGLAAVLGLGLLPAFSGLWPAPALQAGHGAIARTLLEKGEFRLDGGVALDYPPLYALALAPAFLLEEPLPAIQGAQVLLAVSGLLPLWLLFRRWVGEVRPLATFLLALLPPAVFLAPFQIAPENLLYPIFAWWLLAGVRTIGRGSPLAAFAWGSLGGLAALAIPAGSTLAPLLVLALAARVPGRSAAARIAARAACFALALLGFFAAVFPWVLWVSRTWGFVPPPPLELAPGTVATNLALGAGFLLLGTGVFPVPAAIASLPRLAAKGLSPLVVLLPGSAVALAFSPSSPGPCPIAALYPAFLLVAFPAFRERAAWTYVAVCPVVPLFLLAGASGAAPGAGSLVAGLVLLWLLLSAAALSRLGARRTLVSLAALAIVLPNAPRILEARRSRRVYDPLEHAGRWLERRGPRGSVFLQPSGGVWDERELALARVIQFESGRPVLPRSSPEAVYVLARERRERWPPAKTFVVAGADGEPVEYYLYEATDSGPP
ncbi:MAG: hypothetical protein HY720_23840 [Planctomycetes bacterium]|nr:hypothetical protein [Planctomycetota bacterium]